MSRLAKILSCFALVAALVVGLAAPAIANGGHHKHHGHHGQHHGHHGHHKHHKHHHKHHGHHGHGHHKHHGHHGHHGHSKHTKHTHDSSSTSTTRVISSRTVKFIGAGQGGPTVTQVQMPTGGVKAGAGPAGTNALTTFGFSGSLASVGYGLLRLFRRS